VIEGLDEEIVAACVLPENVQGLSIMFATSSATVKRTDAQEYRGAWRKGGVAAITLDEGDSIVAVSIVHDDDDIMLISKDGAAIRFPVTDVRPIGRTGRGVIGMRCESPIVDMIVLHPGENRDLLLVTEKGFAKRCATSLFRDQRRGGKGILGIKTDERTGRVAACRLVADDDDIVVITDMGVSNRVAASEVRTLGRNASGARLVKLDDGSKVAFVSVAKAEEEESPTENAQDSAQN